LTADAFLPGTFLPATAIGVVGGLMVGMTGVGAGSVIAALLLISYPNVSPQVIVGSASMQAVAMKVVAVWARRRFGLNERGLGLAMAAGAIPLAIAGAWYSSRLSGAALRPILAAVLVAVGLMLMVQTLWPRREPADEGRAGAGRAGASRAVGSPADGDPPLRRVGLLGAGVGFIAGLTSVGTGTLFVSALTGLLRIEVHRAVGAALLAGLLTLVFSSITHALLGHYQGALVAGTVLGSIPGVLFGSAISQRLHPRALRGIVGAGIVVAAVLSVVRLRG
jgi:uncharacterized membrane protein YfcA